MRQNRNDLVIFESVGVYQELPYESRESIENISQGKQGRMSEFEPNTARPTDFQLEMLITDVESKFIAAEDALSDLRHSVRQLKLYKPQTSTLGTETPMPSSAPAQPYFEPLPQEFSEATENGAFGETSELSVTEPYQEAKPKLHEDTVGVPYWPGPAKQEPAPESEHVNENYGLDSTSEASWPIARPAQPREPVPEPAPEEPSQEFNWLVAEQPVESPTAEPEAEAPQASGEEDDEVRREEVARIVAQMREGGEDEESASSSDEDTPDEEEARRRDVAKMVAELRDSTDVVPEAPKSNGSGPEGKDEEARRQEVAWTVAEMRSGGFDSEEPPSEEDHEATEDSEATREDVANMVAQMRAEFDAGTFAPDAEQTPEAGDDDAEVRDEVRRAVEAARAEMASGYKDTGDEPGASESKFSFTDWQSTRTEPSGPPVIVIKDSEGRVELARVYETLSRVNCDENAALLNYTPHSVTIGLNITAAVPEIEAMSEAVRSVFGRACEVDSDGVRVNVQIGRDLKGKDSAA
jgi:hypothetical protein